MKVLHKLLLVFVFRAEWIHGFQSTATKQSLGPLHIATPETDQGKDNVSYVVARGDGSTGGGGLPMPKVEEDNGLRRPKVGAEMPEG